MSLGQLTRLKEKHCKLAYIQFLLLTINCVSMQLFDFIALALLNEFI